MKKNKKKDLETRNTSAHMKKIMRQKIRIKKYPRIHEQFLAIFFLFHLFVVLLEYISHYF